MKQLKSSFGEFHRLFQQSITARDIAEPLTSFDCTQPAGAALEFMTERSYDVAGVRRNGDIGEYILRENLPANELVGDCVNTLTGNDVLNENDSILQALESMKTRSWIFIRFLGNPSGIITRGDLQKGV